MGERDRNRALIRFSNGYAHLSFDGAPTSIEFRNAFHQFAEHGSFGPGCPLMWDLRETRFDQIGVDDLRFIAEHAAELDPVWGHHRVAVVVSRDLEFGLGRVYEVFADRKTLELEIFRDAELAERWLLDAGES